jgi:hypothetical protein
MDVGVEGVFAGHYHRNSRAELGSMQMITSSSIGPASGKGQRAKANQA